MAPPVRQPAADTESDVVLMSPLNTLFFQKLNSSSHLDTHLKPHYTAERSGEVLRVRACTHIRVCVCVCVCVCVSVTDTGQEKKKQNTAFSVKFRRDKRTG